MSGQAQGGPSAPKDDNKEKRFSRLLTRAKTVFNKKTDGKGTKSKPVTVPHSATITTAPDTAPVVKHQPSPSAQPSKTVESPEYPDAVRVLRAQIFEERAKKISERFGLEIRPSTWYPIEGHALRVEKPIRMRVSRECHKCGHTFGSAKECPSCQHIRCKDCPRQPPKRSDAEKEESRKKRAAMLKAEAENPPILVDWNPTHQKKLALSRPSKTGGQDLVHRKPRQRVRRTCCQCSKLYSAVDAKKCDNCQHTRCTDCPREPPKKNKFPYGYPGDEFGPKSTPHYQCHNCQAKFPPNPAEGEECPKCSHKRCNECPRLQPRKVEPEPDPELLKSVYEKMRKMKIGETADL
jgi:hypothetical protein